VPHIGDCVLSGPDFFKANELAEKFRDKPNEFHLNDAGMLLYFRTVCKHCDQRVLSFGQRAKGGVKQNVLELVLT
jgi:hypothetical protein